MGDNTVSSLPHAKKSSDDKSENTAQEGILFPGCEGKKGVEKTGEIKSQC